MAGRVTQLVETALTSASPNARATQLVETALTSASPKARATQLVLAALMRTEADVFTVDLTGDLSFSGSLLVPDYFEEPTAALSFSGFLDPQEQISLAASLAFSGAIGIEEMFLDFPASVSFSGDLGIQESFLDFLASLSFSGDLGIQENFLDFLASLSFAGDLSPTEMYLAFAASLGFTGELKPESPALLEFMANLWLSGTLGASVIPVHPPACVPRAVQQKTPFSAIRKEPDERKGT